MSTSSKIAIIGLGHIGSILAKHFTTSNRPVILADRKISQAEKLANELGASAKPSQIEMAVKEAGIVILSIPFGSIADFLSVYRNDLAGKIIIDPSNAIAPDENGGFKKIIGPDESAGEINAALLPASATLVKAFGSLGAASLQAAAFQQPDPAVLFFATDNSAVAATIAELIREVGFAALKIGGLNQSIRMEVFGDLHEFGALGKTVTESEAKNLNIKTLPDYAS